MKKSYKIISILLVLAMSLNCFLFACDKPNGPQTPADTYKVVFDYNDGGASRPLIKLVEKTKSISSFLRI